MDPSVLTVYQSPFVKLRLGNDYDGGYIIADIPNIKYTTLLAGGIDTDISFEDAFLNKYTNVKAYAFDGTINALPKTNNDIKFIKKNVGFQNDEEYTNIHDIIDADENKSIFVKMDIESAEVYWIRSLSNEQMNKFEQIAIEFHFPFSENEIQMFDKINRNHYLIHFHPNNCCGVRNYKGVIIPNVFECTYLHKKYFIPTLNKDLIPSSLDMKNTPNDEIYINYPPFVN
jgi:hypothetical protein